MAAKKSVTKPVVNKKVAAKPAQKKAAPAAPVAPARAPSASPSPAAKRPAGPSARLCPLVMDGEIDASDFSPGDCLTCSEFDCRFCEAEEGSGTLRSRLFASEDSDGDDEGFGGDFSIGGDEEGLEDSGVGEDEDQF